jgi:ribosomal protein L34E
MGREGRETTAGEPSDGDPQVGRTQKREIDEGWRASAEETLVGIKEWRKAHPKATLTEIEEAIDRGLNQFRKQVVRDVAEASSVKSWAGASKEERPTCPDCGRPLQSSGSDERRLVTQGGEVFVLERAYGLCPSCKKGLFPPG